MCTAKYVGTYSTYVYTDGNRLNEMRGPELLTITLCMAWYASPKYHFNRAISHVMRTFQFMLETKMCIWNAWEETFATMCIYVLYKYTYTDLHPFPY